MKFNVSILNRLKIMFFFINTKYIHKHNVIFNKTVTKLATIFTKYFFYIWTLQATLNMAFSWKFSKVFPEKHTFLTIGLAVNKMAIGLVSNLLETYSEGYQPPLLMTKHSLNITPSPPAPLPPDWWPTHLNSHHQNFTSFLHFWSTAEGTALMYLRPT